LAEYLILVSSPTPFNCPRRTYNISIQVSEKLNLVTSPTPSLAPRCRYTSCPQTKGFRKCHFLSLKAPLPPPRFKPVSLVHHSKVLRCVNTVKHSIAYSMEYTIVPNWSDGLYEVKSDGPTLYYRYSGTFSIG
jgi:hypothetical protein